MCVGDTTDIIKYKAPIAGTRVEYVASHRLDIDRFARLGPQDTTSDIAYSQATIARRHVEVAVYIADIDVLTGTCMD